MQGDDVPADAARVTGDQRHTIQQQHDAIARIGPVPGSAADVDVILHEVDTGHHLQRFVEAQVRAIADLCFTQHGDTRRRFLEGYGAPVSGDNDGIQRNGRFHQCDAYLSGMRQIDVDEMFPVTDHADADLVQSGGDASDDELAL